jgi:hypothetical protein
MIFSKRQRFPSVVSKSWSQIPIERGKRRLLQEIFLLGEMGKVRNALENGTILISRRGRILRRNDVQKEDTCNDEPPAGPEVPGDRIAHEAYARNGRKKDFTAQE